MDDDGLLDLPSLRLVVQIADEGSLVGAGRAFGISASAVGKTLARLEARLGMRLFHRNTRSLTPTEEGSMVLMHARHIVAEAEALREGLSGRMSAPQGRLRLSLPLVGEPFVGVLAAFSRAFPEIELDLDFSDRQVDVIAEGYDAAIRSGEVGDTRLTATSLGSFRMKLSASPAYLADQGTPKTVQDLLGHRCIRFRFAHNGKIGDWPLDRAIDRRLKSALVSNDLKARVAMTVAGAGIALLPSFAVAGHLRDGSLIPVLPEVGDTVLLTMLRPPSRQLTPKIRALSTYLAQKLRPLLE